MAGMIPQQGQAPAQEQPGQPPQPGQPQPGQQPGGQPQISPEDADLAERFALAARAAISSKKAGPAIVETASQGSEGVALAAHSILNGFRNGGEIPPEDLPIAMVAIVMELFAFLSSTGKVKEDPAALRRALAMALVKLVPEIGMPEPAELQELDGIIPGLAQEMQTILQSSPEGQAAPAPEQGGMPPQGQPQPPQGGMLGMGA